MNRKQALVLAIGTLAAVILVMIPRTSTQPRLISTKTLPDGEIVTTYRSRQSFWQPVLFTVVLLVTGGGVYVYRRK